MDRITGRHLAGLVERINRIRKAPLEPYTGHRANSGNYHISQAYGGVCLHQMSNQGGGVMDVFHCGHVPKRDLYHRLTAFIQGLETL